MKNYALLDKLVIRVPASNSKSKFSKNEIISFFSKEENIEALYLSTQSLYREFKLFLEGNLGVKRSDKLILSLHKYILRIHNRCTPFGLLASCGVASFGTTSNIELKGRRRKSQLDMGLLSQLISNLSKQESIKQKLKYYPNSSSYVVGSKLRYIEYNNGSGYRKYQVTAVDFSTYLKLIFKRCENGAKFSELLLTLQNFGLNEGDAKGYIERLIDNQIISSNLDPNVTGKDTLSCLIDTLKKTFINCNDIYQIRLLHELENILRQLEEFDSKFTNQIQSYDSLNKKVNQMPFYHKSDNFYQVDSFLSLSDINHTLEKQIKADLKSALNFLYSYKRDNKNSLDAFKSEFIERYGENEISLFHVLDPDVGIGYGQNKSNDLTPLLEGIKVNGHGNETSFEMRQNEVERFMYRKLQHAIRFNKKILKIRNDEVSKFNNEQFEMSDSFSIIFSHLGIHNGSRKLLLKSAGGASGNQLIGRFANSCSDIKYIAKQIAQCEAKINNDFILAEIVHLPESRVGNILRRPILRDFEIPYLARTTLNPKFQIPVKDLMLSVVENELFLRSKRLNKRVIPKMSNAHNYTLNSLPVYHFLNDIQYQNTTSDLFFDWGALNEENFFLPRVELGNVILKEARWKIRKEQYRSVIDGNMSHLEWKDKWDLPDKVLLKDGENDLLIDFTCKMGQKLFNDLISKKELIVLKEYLFNDEGAVVKCSNGLSYANEFIAFAIKKSQAKDYSEQLIRCSKNSIKSKFLVGSEWVYFKVYTGVSSADNILSEAVKPIVDNLINKQLIDSWFFIRYADPRLHLRIRLHVSDISNVENVIKTFTKKIEEFEKDKVVWKTQIDTYQREIQRYGYESIVFSEKIFYYDSSCIVDFISLFKGHNKEELRWKFGFLLIENLLSDFKFSIKEKLQLVEELRYNYYSEFKVTKELKLKLDKKYRSKSKEIRSLIFEPRKEVFKEYTLLQNLLIKKSECIKEQCENLLELNTTHQLKVELCSLIKSHVHMSLNRLFRSKQRTHELVLYDFLWRTYRSELAINKKIL